MLIWEHDQLGKIAHCVMLRLLIHMKHTHFSFKADNQGLNVIEMIVDSVKEFQKSVQQGAEELMKCPSVSDINLDQPTTQNPRHALNVFSRVCAHFNVSYIFPVQKQFIIYLGLLFWKY